MQGLYPDQYSRLAHACPTQAQVTAMIDPCTDAQFRAILDRLRAVCPPPRGVSITATRVPKLDALGYTAKKKNRKFEIEIRAEMCENLTIFVAIHEWSHVFDWQAPHPLAPDHGATWGVWASRVYQKYHGVE